MSENITELTSENFDSFIAQGVSVIDFWAPWCGPCRLMSPIFEAVAKELKGKVKFGKVNVDEESELAERFQVMSIPTLGFFKNGSEEERSIGLLDKDELLSKASSI